MKRKFIALILVLCLCLPLTGCEALSVDLDLHMPDWPTIASSISSAFSNAYASVVSLFTKGAPDTMETDLYTIYRTADSASLTEKRSDLIQAESYAVEDDALDDIEAVLDLFALPSKKDGLVSALPEGVTIEDWELDNVVVTLTLSPSFLDLTEMEQTITAFCAVLTLCELDSVEAVTIMADDQVLFSRLMAEDALLADDDADPYVRQLRLYFADGEGRYLLSEYHSLTLDEDTSPERYVVEELLRGPNSNELQSAIPAGTTLLSCSTTDRVCTVDLSAGFYDDRPETAIGERLAIYSIVDSLTSLSDVDSVVILVEGQTLDTYVYRSLAEPLYWYDEVIGPVSTPRGEIDGTLYLPMPGLDSLAAMPCRIDVTGYESQVEAVLSALFSFAEPGYPTLFSSTSSITDVLIENDFCVIDLSESFFVSLPAEARNVAVQSIAATLCALDEVDSVYFTISGDLAIYDGVDWSGPWSDFTQITVS